MILRLIGVWERLRASYWFVPTLLAAVAALLAFGMGKVDLFYGSELARKLGWTYTGGPEGARGVLSAIAGSVIGVAGTTFSITIAVLSLASGQYGPRLLRGFMRDLGNQIVLGTFTATYLYCLLVLRTVRGTDETTFVPHFSVTVGVVLAILSVAVLIYFVHHVAESIQVSHIVEEAGREADDAVDRLFPKEIGDPDGHGSLPDAEPERIATDRIGYITSIDGDALLALAERHGLVVRMDVRPGDYVLPGQGILSVWPRAEDHAAAMRRCFSFGRQRTTFQDAEFAFRQLAEIAVRALSPGTNDPFTAIQCLDRITATMCHLGQRHWPASFRHDERGALRVVAKPLTPEAIVRAAYGHIYDHAKEAPSVLQKLRDCLEAAAERAEDPALGAALKKLRERC